MGSKKWPALINATQQHVRALQAHRIHVRHMNSQASWHGMLLHDVQLKVVACCMQAAEKDPQTHVQLFATGIKTSVRRSAVRRFCSSDTCTDESVLGRKVRPLPQGFSFKHMMQWHWSF